MKPGFAGCPAIWSGQVTTNTPSVIHTSTERPADWPALPRGCANYVQVLHGEHRTGYPVAKVSRDRVVVARFPLQTVAAFRLPALQFTTLKRR